MVFQQVKVSPSLSPQCWNTQTLQAITKCRCCILSLPCTNFGTRKCPNKYCEDCEMVGRAWRRIFIFKYLNITKHYWASANNHWAKQNINTFQQNITKPLQIILICLNRPLNLVNGSIFMSVLILFSRNKRKEIERF